MEAIACHHPDSTGSRWTAAIDRAVHEPDPELANLLITQVHHDLGLAMRELLGSDSGANFHAWATWGSREAGTTIRMDDVPGLPRFAPARPVLRRARLAISAGNRMVLDEIGRESARFIESGGSYESPVVGLRDTFLRYRDAVARVPVARRRAKTFAANVGAVWHEHVRLQPYIARAMPFGFRHLITRTLLDFRVGAEHLHVSREIALGAAARDWSDFAQRMRYVRALFDTRHLDPEVFAAPYGRELAVELRRDLGLVAATPT